MCSNLSNMMQHHQSRETLQDKPIINKIQAAVKSLKVILVSSTNWTSALKKPFKILKSLSCVSSYMTNSDALNLPMDKLKQVLIKKALNQIYTSIKKGNRASLVAQQLRIHLPMQGTWVRALVREDPTYCGATKPVCHNY